MSFWDNLQDSLGSIGDLTSTLFNPIGSIANVWSTFEGVKQNKKVNDLNYQLQKDDLAYRKDLQNLMFQREDNAVQRRVSDLRKAGLSPVLAAGSSASSGPVVSTSAPQRVSDLNGYMALAQIGTMLANQQKAQTEAENARLIYEQNKMNTDYFKDNGISPVESGMSLSQLLVNKFNSEGNDVLDRILEGVAKFFEREPREGIPFSGFPSWSSPMVKPFVNKNGESITAVQKARLRNYGLLDDWYNGTRTEDVDYILYKYDDGSAPVTTLGDSAKVLWNTITGWFNK